MGCRFGSGKGQKMQFTKTVGELERFASFTQNVSFPSLYTSLGYEYEITCLVSHQAHDKRYRNLVSIRYRRVR